MIERKKREMHKEHQDEPLKTEDKMIAYTEFYLPSRSIMTDREKEREQKKKKDTDREHKNFIVQLLTKT